MSKTRDALKLPVFLPRVWGRGSKGRPLPQPFWGLDTERNVRDGRKDPRFNDFVCGWISNEKTSVPFRTFADLGPGTYWIWNLGYDIEAMVADLRLPEGFAMREDGSPFTLGSARCVYFKDKRFEWNDDGGRRVFLEASSFFNRIGLKDAAKTLCVCLCEGCSRHKKEPVRYQHCGREEAICPMKDPVDASQMSLTRYESEKSYRDLVNRYCAKDARIAFRLMEFLARGFRDLGVEIAGTPGSTTKRFLSDVAPFPKVIWATHRRFLQGYCGGRFEPVKRGVFFNARQYDIVSAYPWALAKCPMLTATATHNETRRLTPESLYGIYEVEFESDEYLGMAPGWRGTTRVFTKAESSVWLCKPELEWLISRGHNYKILRGTEVFDPNPTQGWRDLVMPLFEKKQTFKNQPLGLGAKVGVNSMYGILIQLIKKGGVWVPAEEAVNPIDFAGLLALEKGPPAFDAGQFYAPIYSATLTSMVRVRLLETAIRAGTDNVIAFHTDAIHLKDNATIPENPELGGFTLERKTTGDDELVILKSGQYSIGDYVKGRGFSKRKLNPLDEDEIAVRQKVDLWAETHTRKSRVSVRTALDWRDVSAIESKTVANNIAWEVKRDWRRAFTPREIQSLISRKEWIDSDALAYVDQLGPFGV